MKATNALVKPITALLTEPTVINSRVFQEMQRALIPFDMRIVTVGASTANFINENTGLRDSITIRHKDYYNNKCFLFAIVEAFHRYSELLRPLCTTLPDTVPRIIEDFTTTAYDDTFLSDLAHLLNNENVLMSLFGDTKITLVSKIGLKAPMTAPNSNASSTSP